MTTNWQRHAEGHPRGVELMTSMLMFAIAVFGSTLSASGAHRPHGLLPAVLLAAVSCGVLLKSSTHPRISVLLTTNCAVAASELGYLLTPLTLAPVMAALYWLALLTDRRTTRIYGAVVAALLVATALVLDPVNHPLVLKTLGPAFWVLVPVVSGSAARLRHDYVEAVQSRAEYAERTREEEARLRVAEERMRIARELHDVVAHHLTLANAQAGTAAHLARTHPEQVRQILVGLAATTTEALRELKATVGLLRHANDPDAPLEPAPGLARLPELTAACRAAGIKVAVTTEGDPRPLSPGVDLTAFRIVQEALTNIAKHATAATAHIRLGYHHNRLTITVTDDGTSTAPATPATGHGYGLIGMRERAHSVGGDLEAGHRSGGGFEVTTRLPLHPHPRPHPRDAAPPDMCSAASEPMVTKPGAPDRPIG
jgi:signal transduction histidine kinase